MSGQSYTVGQVNHYIAGLFQEDFLLRRIRVKGEVSNLIYHKSGHIYFSLKDSSGVLGAAMWRSQRASGLTFAMREGDQVVVSGTVQVYEKGGSYKLIASQIEKEGLGDLYVRFEALKKQLSEMGMFDASYKKQIPRYATKIGIVTAPTGAAIRDIIQVSKRRYPGIEIVLYPALVQGEKAVASIVRGIQTLDAMGMDLLIVGRGGGSMEDLWAFNEESVARAIFDCRTPLISAVGHETDTTIADFVADLRAPTPSAAAELAVFDYASLQKDLRSKRERMASAMQYRLNTFRNRLADIEHRLETASPQEMIRNLRGRLDGARHRLNQAHPSRRISLTREEVLRARQRLCQDMDRRLEQKRQLLAVAAERLDGLSPVRKLASGFSYVQDKTGRRVEDAGKLKVGDFIHIYLHRGQLDAEVSGISLKKDGFKG